jgi:HPr kinase/phosphorylase
VTTAPERIEGLVGLEPPLIVVSKAMEQTAALFASACNRHEVPLALTAATTSAVIERLAGTLEFLLAAREVVHGDLLDIFAIGVLILGDSGSGKSEGALELVHRGHRLVADDVVEIYRVRNEDLVGQAPEEVRGLMEVRGLGLISIEQLFGVVAVRDSKPIDLVVKLVAEKEGPVERLGLSENTIEILGLRRPLLTVPVAPGKSLALLIEAAARKYLLSQRGVADAATEYLARHDQKLEGR